MQRFKPIVTLAFFHLILWHRDQRSFPLSSLWNVASSSFLKSETKVMLLYVTVISWIQTKMNVWPSFCRLETIFHGSLLRWTTVSGEKIDNTLYQLLTAWLKPYLIYSVGKLIYLLRNFASQTSLAITDTLLPLLVTAGMPSWHQAAASHGLALLIVEVESWMSPAYR